MTVKSIENYDEFKEVISSETLVIIYFGAARCRHCTVASPVFEELSKKPEYDGKHKFYEINTDLVESKKATNNAEIQKIPSFLLFRSGEQVTSTNKAGELDTLIKNHTTTAASMTSAPAEANAVDLELDARIKDHTTTAALAQAALSKGEINSDPENNALVLQLDTLIKILDRIAPTPPVADAPSVADPAPPYTCSLPIKYLPPEDPNDIEKNQIKSLHHYLAMIKEKQQTIIVFADGGRIRSTNKELKEDNKWNKQKMINLYSVADDCVQEDDICSDKISEIMSYAGIDRLPVVLFYKSRVLIGDSRVLPKSMKPDDDEILTILNKLTDQAQRSLRGHSTTHTRTKIIFHVLNIITLGAVSSSLYNLWQAQGKTTMTVRYPKNTDRYRNDWEEYFNLKKEEWKAIGIMASLLTAAAAACLTFMDDNEVNVAPRLLSIISMGCSLGGAISSTILLAAFVGVNSIRLAWVHGGALFVLALSAPRGWLRWAIITLQSSLLAFVWNDRTRSAKIVITIILAIQATLYLFLPIGRLTWSRDTYYWNIFTPAMPLTPLLLPKTPPSTPGSSVAKAGTAHSTSPPSTEPANTISKRASDFSIV